VIPPDASAAFVANMEDVLEVYQRPHDPQRPLVCLDETSKQLIGETRAPIPAKPGRKARHDYEYERNGVANLFMVFAPLEGWRHVKVSDRHTAIDYAHTLRDLSDVHFPDAAKIVLVQDNLNTHKPASLYEAFPAPEARRLVERFEWHYTPKHGKLARHGRIRARRSRVPMSEPPHCRQKTPRPRSQRMAGPPKQAPRQGQLAVQNRRRPRQAQEAVPSVRMTRATRDR
jgi:DDE superfamily endonuclease